MTAPTPDHPGGRPAIDPRIRDRRIEVLREAGRRRLRVTLVVASTIVVIGLVYLGLRSPLLDLDHVRVTGARRESVSEIERAAGMHTGDPLLFVDTGAAARRIERLPWVAHARVERHLPGTITIAVTEYQPSAYVRVSARRVVLVASTGRVIARAASVPRGAVEVIGEHVVPAVGSLLSPPEAANVVRQLPPRLRARIRAIDLRRPSVALDLRGAGNGDGGQVRLGTLDDIAAKGIAALAVLDHLAGQSCAYIDVAAPQAPVARC